MIRPKRSPSPSTFFLGGALLAAVAAAASVACNAYAATDAGGGEAQFRALYKELFQINSATDGRFLNANGVLTYGLSGMFHDADGSHAHGLNERIRVKSLMDGRRFLYQVVKLYAEAQ